MVDLAVPEGEAGAPSLEQDREQHRRLLGEVTTTAGQVSASMTRLVSKLQSGPPLDQGISFLSVRAGLLQEYNMNLAYVILKKTRGETIQGDPAVGRLCYLRTLLEKVRPIEHKLKYQVEKFLTLAETGEVRSDDPSRFKANPGLMASKLGEEEEDDDDEDEEEAEKEKTGQKYVAPKNVPKHFDEDKSKEEMMAEQAAKKKKSALSHSMMRDLKSQMWDTPEEISHESDTRKQKYIASEKEKALYEEDMFTRLPITKADKQARSQLSTVSNIGDSLTSFGNSNFDGEGGGKKRKGKGGGEKGGKKKKFKIKKKKF